MLAALLALILLPILAIFLIAVVGAGLRDFRQTEPFFFWLFVGIACVFTVLSPIPLWKDWKRRKEIRAFNEQQAREAAEQAAKS